MKTYMVFHIVAYNKTVGEGVNIDFIDKVVLRLIDLTLDSAIERAKKIVQREFFMLAEVVEYNKDK